jgi:colicin import membrane protein
MSEFLRKHWTYLIGAVLLHVVFVGVFGLTMLKFARKPQPVTLAIQAVVVDRSVIERTQRQQQRDRAQEREQQRQQQEAEQRKQQERREAEQKVEQQRQQEQKQREDQQRREVEEQQVREKQEAERKVQAEAERKAQVEAERQRKAEEERKRVAEIERKQKEEAERRKAADDTRAQQQREAELRKQLESEEGENELKQSDAYAAYRLMIARHIERYWNKPPSARAGVVCEVTITQAPTGSVLSVRAGECGDGAMRQSIEVAVQRASPLPTPEDPRLFDRTVILQFKPE